VLALGVEVAGPDALVSGTADRTGAHATASFFTAAFIASSAFCIGAGSGIITAPDRPPPEPVGADEAPVGVLVGPEARVDVLVDPVAPVDPLVPVDVRAEEPEAPEPVVEPEPPDEVVVVDASSAVSWAWACNNAAWASVTAACSGVWSIVASCWPGVTVSPTLTETPVTVPLTGKAAVTWDTRLTVPVRVRVWETDPVVALASR
jgi:hypothetical protein